MTPPDRRVALSLLAHPDDAEILCAGTLIRLADLGWTIHIATLTAGDCGTATESPDAISARRRAEAATAAAHIGATYHCLDEKDLYITFNPATIRKAIDLLRSIDPTLVFTHAPADYMTDHEVTSQLARAATFGYAAPNASDTPVTPGSAVPHLYYCDPLEGIDPLGNPVTPTTLIDITAVLDRKADMLAAHASQRDWLRHHHGMDEYLDSMKRHAAARGRLIQRPAAEAFVQHRGHAYPRHDLLADLLN